MQTEELVSRVRPGRLISDGPDRAERRVDGSG